MPEVRLQEDGGGMTEPDAKAKRREYYQRPEVRARRRAQYREYFQPPDAKGERRDYHPRVLSERDA